MAQSLKNFDWRSMQKYLDPKASGDLNAFLEKLPQNAGQTVLIAAGIAWATAGALGLYTSVQARALTDVRAKLKEADALTPTVPRITDAPIDKTELDTFVKDISGVYKGLNIQVQGSSIIITSSDTARYAAFREAISHVQNGGAGWRVKLEKLCVGRECEGGAKLGITLIVNKVSVENPAP